ncbi:hypothetical protein Taro_029162 [Colocasia esculenta]|uniref:Serine aminopeptidase S33 domain-containing protein n=1 Tax=Colocasia esculenta TaxID=4460 RepID=A0A843VQA4_COLES|nr:hypothetical protein [Colocasia esculenta]
MAHQHPIHHANEHSPFGDLPADEFYRHHKVLHHEVFITTTSSHGPIKLFTQSWCPDYHDKNSDAAPLRGLVAMVHGYSAESGWMFGLTAVAFAKLGFRVVALDLPGHGQSEGRRGHIPDINPVVDACAEFFEAARAGHDHLPAFLYGESLGGAVAALVCMRQRGRWSGLVLSGAMCGVSPRMMPPWPLEHFLPVMAMLTPDWRVLTKPLARCSLKEGWKRRLFENSPHQLSSGRPPASTALELMRVAGEVGRRGAELELPLLVVHGGDDAVCDQESAERLYASARTGDKTLRVLPGVWHQLVGEPPEGVEAAFGIVFSWLVGQAEKASRPPHRH